MNTERGKLFAIALKNADQIPVEDREMSLPDFADSKRMKNGQRAFLSNLHATLFTLYMGLVALMAIPAALKILMHANKTTSIFGAYRRYMNTIRHVLSWYREDISPGSKAWKSLKYLRDTHFRASRSAKNANLGIISQQGMAIDQYVFIGFAVLSPKESGFHIDKKQMQDMCHLWRVLGYVMGIKDEYNLCTESFEETVERLSVVRSEFIMPCLKDPPEHFESMAKFLTSALWNVDPLDSHNEIMFMLKRHFGVPGYYYLQKEIPKNYDRKNLALLKLPWRDRIVIWISVMARQYLLHWWIFRWLYNVGTALTILVVQYFPLFAILKFGFRKSYVNFST